VPEETGGTVDVRVDNGCGLSANNLADQFTFLPNPLPTVISLSESSGAPGDTLTITGTNFSPPFTCEDTGLGGFANEVFFGAAPADIMSSSATSVTVTVPIGPSVESGTVDVRVDNGCVISSTTSADEFTYPSSSAEPSPVITSLSETAGAPGDTLTITGTNLESSGCSGDPSVFFGTARDFFGAIDPSATSLSVTVPSNVSLGSTVAVIVDNQCTLSAPAGSAQFTFSVPIPVITSLSETEGAAGDALTITGKNLQSGECFGNGGSTGDSGTTPVVYFNDVGIRSDPTAVSPTSLTVTVPFSVGAAEFYLGSAIEVIVDNNCAPSPSAASAHFTYELPIPTITSLSESAGLPGSMVTITGTNLEDACNSVGDSVFFGGEDTGIPSADLSPTQITVTVPFELPGPAVDVVVNNTCALTDVTAADQFTFEQQPGITVQPLNQTVTAGAAAMFTASASGSPAPSVQWVVSTDHGSTFTDIAGANSNALMIAGATLGQSGNEYEAVYTNVTGRATTNPAALIVNPVPGYDLAGSDGGVFVFPVGQSAGFYGSLPALGGHVNDVVGIVPTNNFTGYNLVGSDGGVFVFPVGQSAGFYGSLPGLEISVSNVVGIVPTDNDRGYDLVGSDGGVFVFPVGQSAGFFGSLPGMNVHVNDVVGIVASPGGGGYFLVGNDGGVFTFGNASFFGSLPGIGVSAKDITGIASTPDGKGYYVVGANGAVYAFGDATSFGSLPAMGVTVSNIVSIVPTPDGEGYWLIGSDGGVFAFGDAANQGSLPGLGVSVENVVGAVPTG
jgi:hypothetical protein